MKPITPADIIKQQWHIMHMHDYSKGRISNGKWKLRRPDTLTLSQRLIGAWLVLIGKCDPLDWQ